jgi:hypothetical protein
MVQTEMVYKEDANLLPASQGLTSGGKRRKRPVADVEAVCKDLKLNNCTKANKKAMVADIEMLLKLVKE